MHPISLIYGKHL